jgi:very-short-patch-repair endonuclease
MKKALSCHVPNRDERFFISLLSQRNLPYRFVGDGSLIIAGKNPDFASTDGQKKLIELFGETWHEPYEEQERCKFFEERGYKALIVWREDLLKHPDAVMKIVDQFNRF